ncbi:cellulase family glycosylhydrolase [Kitasatospora sp. NPDC057223]|uniref:cellulase family glycosylhydrolase n=1 Tax=Kitasatospora sp. NPDC057223 TaxID=3346055 RepID=UPI003636F4F0
MGKLSGRRQRLLVAVVAFVISAVATIVATDSPSAVAPSDSAPGSTSSAPAPAGGESGPAAAQASNGRQLHIGIAYGDTLTWKSDKDLAIGLDDAANSGAKWVRVDLSWKNIQPENSKHYEWQRFDRVVKAARDRKLEVLPTIAYTPAWARKAGCQGDDASCPPADPALFAAFAEDAAQRYAPMGVHTWEIWNEPNIPFWAPKPDPAAYTKLLEVTSKALRAADPKAYVLMGGLAAVGTNPEKAYVSQTDFLTEVSKLGANRMVDAISYHPYTYPDLPSARTTYGTAFEQISTAKDNLVAVLDKYGTPDLPIWLTETGAPTDGPGTAADGKSNAADTATHVTEEFQAAIATDTIPASAANRHVEAVFWFADQDAGTDKDRAHRSLFYGLRRYDGSPKPSLDAFGSAIAAYEKQQKQQKQ